jgi:hypothetical protein
MKPKTGDKMDEIEQLPLDEAFAYLADEMKQIFHNKNMKYNNAFFAVNEKNRQGFDDATKIYHDLEIALKYDVASFNPKKYNEQLLDLAVMCVMNVMLNNMIHDEKQV